MVWRNKVTIEELKEILNKVYCKETAYPDCQDKWNKNNPTFGQCAVTSLLIQHYALKATKRYLRRCYVAYCNLKTAGF